MKVLQGCLVLILVVLCYILLLFLAFAFGTNMILFHVIFFGTLVFLGLFRFRGFDNRESTAQDVNSSPDQEKPSLPTVEYRLEDFFKIEEIDGVIRVCAKNLEGVKEINLRWRGNSSECLGICYSSGNGPMFYFKAPNGKWIGFQPEQKGVLKFFCDSENIVQGQLVAELDTRKETIVDFELRMEERRRKQQEEEERWKMAERIKKAYHKRTLKKMVEQELIDRGEIFPSAKRPPIAKEVADAVYRRDGGRCVYCGSTENLHFDHIIPFSKGGDTSVENLQLLCRKCNLEKSNKIG